MLKLFFNSRTLVFPVVVTAILGTATMAYADKGGAPNAHADAAAQGAAAGHAHSGHGGSSLIVGITPVTAGATAYLQFTNAGTQAGTVTVTIYAAGSGTQLATWTSPSIPVQGSLLQDVAAIASGASPALTSAQASAPVDLAIQSTIHGTVQTLILVNGALSNISACGPTRHDVVGGVPGPGNTTLAGTVQIGNDGDATAHATISLYNSTDGTKLGSWTSADVPPKGAISVSTTAIAAAATPPVPATTTSFTLAADPDGLGVLAFAVPKAGGAPVLLNNACPLKGSGAEAAQDESDGSAD